LERGGDFLLSGGLVALDGALKKVRKKEKKIVELAKEKKSSCLVPVFFSVQTYDDSKIVIFFLHIVRERRIFLKLFFCRIF